MANPLTHGLVSMAVYALAATLLGLSALSGGLLLAGLLAMALDYDESEDHAGHSPWAHSVLLAVIAVAASCGIATAVGMPSPMGVSLAVGAAFGSHLALDVFSEGGIYLCPRRVGRSWRWTMIRYRLRYGDDDPWYNLCATAPALLGLVGCVAL